MRHTFVVVACIVAVVLAARPARAQNGTVDLPLVTVDVTYPLQGPNLLKVCPIVGCTFATLQSAIEAAQPGDTILLKAGSVHSGPIRLKYKPNNTQQKWIVIRSDSTAFDATGSLKPGTRVGPTDNGQMAIINSGPANERAITTLPSNPSTAQGGTYYRLVGLEIRPDPAQTVVTQLVELGNDNTSAQTADHIIIDRCYVHGVDDYSQPTHGNYTRGIALNGTYMAVINSHVSDFHSTNGDAQAISGWNGDGPFKIENNFLSAGHENILFGGQDPSLVGRMASDVEIRGNHLAKNELWRNIYQVSNLLEIKSGRRMLIENNLMEYAWHDRQDGTAIVLKATDQSDADHPEMSVVDITFRNNIVRHAAGGIRISRENGTTGPLGDFLIENNLFDDIDTVHWSISGEWSDLLQITSAPGLPDPQYIFVRNNTFVNENAQDRGHIIEFYQVNVQSLEFTENLVKRNAYGVKGAFTEGQASWDGHTSNSDGGFTRNGIAACPSSSTYNWTGVDNLCLDETTWAAQFTNYNGGSGGDYHLVCPDDGSQNPCTPNQYWSHFGHDIGADINALECAVLGVCGSSGETVLLEDGFNGSGAPDPATWVVGVISGSTENPAISVAQTNGLLQIGPLAATATWNGLYTLGTFSFTGAYASAAFTSVASGAHDYTMLAVVKDVNNFYRLYVHAGFLYFEKKIAGTKTPIGTAIPYSTTQHAFVAIANQNGNVVFMTAPAGGPWQTQASVAWDALIPLTGLRFELKAGADGNDAGTRSAQFDVFKAAIP